MSFHQGIRFPYYDSNPNSEYIFSISFDPLWILYYPNPPVKLPGLLSIWIPLALSHLGVSSRPEFTQRVESNAKANFGTLPTTIYWLNTTLAEKKKAGKGGPR